MPGKPVITEDHVRTAVRAGQRQLIVPPRALVTPLAADTARAAGIELVRGVPPEPGSASPPHHAPPPRTLAIGADHGGFELKQTLAEQLRKDGWHVIDIGTDSPASCDYPDFAYGVARLVATGKAAYGIMIDGAGIGSSMVCNKVPGVRAACAYNEFTAWNARAHNNANVLTLGSRTLGIEVIKGILRVFLETSFEGGRHAKRVDKMTDMESR
ncbi:MAG: ribose 5-phosphate isomerase B [Rhodothermales bacterium]